MLSTEEWVAKVNAMAREMDDICEGVHPTAWPELLEDLPEQYRELAGADTFDQLEMFHLAACPHTNTVLDTTGSRKFVEGDVDDDIEVQVLCLDCGEVICSD